MTKTKTPFFSLGAQGSVGRSITAQRRNSATLLREKPLPSDPYSLPQAYQRWLYEDYAYLWTKQNAATKQTYAAAGSRFHLTGFQYWMKAMLSTLPDILFWTKLDNTPGGTAYDSSKHENDGVIVGASPTTGLISRCLYFDGINDVVNFPNAVAGLFDTQFSFEAFIRVIDPARGQYLLYGRELAAPDIGFQVATLAVSGRLWCLYDFGPGTADAATPAGISANTWYHVVYNHNATKTELWVDGALSNTRAGSAIVPGAGPFRLSRSDLPGAWFNGNLDNVILRNRILDPTEILRKSLRRYPAQ